MQAQVQALTDALTQQTAATNQQAAAVVSLNGVAQNVISTMQTLKSSLDATVALLADGNELAAEDITALQAALTKAGANTQAVIAAAQGVMGTTQQLSNAATQYSASN